MQPDLHQVHRLGRRGIELAVPGMPAPPPGVQHLAGAQHFAGAEAVAVLQRAAHDIGDNLHVAVRVHAEAGRGRNPVVVDYTQAAKAHVVRVVVVAEGSRMSAIEPVECRLAALGGRSSNNHETPPGYLEASRPPEDSAQRGVRAPPAEDEVIERHHARSSEQEGQGDGQVGGGQFVGVLAGRRGHERITGGDVDLGKGDGHRLVARAMAASGVSNPRPQRMHAAEFGETAATSPSEGKQNAGEFGPIQEVQTRWSSRPIFDQPWKVERRPDDQPQHQQAPAPLPRFDL